MEQPTKQLERWIFHFRKADGSISITDVNYFEIDDKFIMVEDISNKRHYVLFDSLIYFTVLPL